MINELSFEFLCASPWELRQLTSLEEVKLKLSKVPEFKTLLFSLTEYWKDKIDSCNFDNLAFQEKDIERYFGSLEIYRDNKSEWEELLTLLKLDPRKLSDSESELSDLTQLLQGKALILALCNKDLSDNQISCVCDIAESGHSICAAMIDEVSNMPYRNESTLESFGQGLKEKAIRDLTNDDSILSEDELQSYKDHLKLCESFNTIFSPIDCYGYYRFNNTSFSNLRLLSTISPSKYAQVLRQIKSPLLLEDIIALTGVTKEVNTAFGILVALNESKPEDPINDVDPALMIFLKSCVDEFIELISSVENEIRNTLSEMDRKQSSKKQRRITDFLVPFITKKYLKDITHLPGSTFITSVLLMLTFEKWIELQDDDSTQSKLLDKIIVSLCSEHKADIVDMIIKLTQSSSIKSARRLHGVVLLLRIIETNGDVAFFPRAIEILQTAIKKIEYIPEKALTQGKYGYIIGNVISALKYPQKHIQKLWQELANERWLMEYNSDDYNIRLTKNELVLWIGICTVQWLIENGNMESASNTAKYVFSIAMYLYITQGHVFRVRDLQIPVIIISLLYIHIFKGTDIELSDEINFDNIGIDVVLMTRMLNALANNEMHTGVLGEICKDENVTLAKVLKEYLHISELDERRLPLASETVRDLLKNYENSIDSE